MSLPLATVRSLTIKSRNLSMLERAAELTRLDHLLIRCGHDNLQFDSKPAPLFETIEKMTIYTSEKIIPESLGQLKYLTRIDVNDALSFPSEVEKLTRLQSLKITHLISGTQTHVPSEVFQSHSLIFLEMRGFIHWPECAVDLPKLERLIFRLNLNTISFSHFNLPQLQVLNIAHCHLETIPDQIGEFTALTHLDLSSNPLKKLPASIGQLTQMVFLDVSNTDLMQLPDEICSLENLEVLKLFSTKLEQLPNHFGQLTNLGELHLGGHPFLRYHVEQGNLLYQFLGLGKVQASIFPDSMTQLQSLTHLSMVALGMRTVPSFIPSLTALQILELQGNEFHKYPPLEGVLSWLAYPLQWLGVQSQFDQVFPAELIRMTHLQSINLQGISKVPPILRKLPTLSKKLQ